MVDEIGRMMRVFANINNVSTSKTLALAVKSWTLTDIHKAQVNVMNYANTAADQIKEELIGDGNKAMFRGRLETAFFELGVDPNFAPTYFPVYDETLFELPSKDEPEKNKQMLDALTDVFGSDAGQVMLALQATAQWANIIVREVSKMLDEVCSFVGYTPELQEQPEPQPTEQEQKLKSLFPDDMKNEKAMTILLNAVKDGAIIIVKDRLKFNGSNALLAYMLGIAFCGDTKEYNRYKQGYKVKRGSAFFPDAFLSKLFGVSNLGQSRLQLDSLPRGYEKVDKWLV